MMESRIAKASKLHQLIDDIQEAIDEWNNNELYPEPKIPQPSTVATFIALAIMRRETKREREKNNE